MSIGTSVADCWEGPLRPNNGEKIYKLTLIACIFKEYYKPLYSLHASDFEMVPLDASLVGITVQPKPVKDASLCQNYRLMLLLNIGVKILAKI